MKRSCLNGLISLAVVLGVSARSWAQSSEGAYPAICTTLNYYLEGGTNNDFKVLQKAFHPNATMKFVNADGYKEVNALDFFREKIKPGPPQNRTTRIVSVSVSGNAASARVEAEYDNFTFVDYMNLLNIAGEWKITAKIFYKKEDTE